MSGGVLEIIAIVAVTGALVVAGLVLFAQVIAAERTQRLIQAEMHGDVINVPESAKAAARNSRAGGDSRAERRPRNVVDRTHDGAAL